MIPGKEFASGMLRIDCTGGASSRALSHFRDSEDAENRTIQGFDEVQIDEKAGNAPGKKQGPACEERRTKRSMRQRQSKEGESEDQRVWFHNFA